MNAQTQTLAAAIVLDHPATPSAAPAPPAAESAAEALKREKNWFATVETNDGRRLVGGQSDFIPAVRNEILAGRLTSSSIVQANVKSQEGKWSQNTIPLKQFAGAHFQLQVLYSPVWSHALAGLKWGALIGIGLKLLDTLILFASIDPVLALLFLVTIVVCAIPRIGLPGMIMISFVMVKFTQVNLFLTLASAFAVGALLGCLPGMAIGGAIGLIRRKHLAMAPDAQRERGALIAKAFLLPLLGGMALWVLYLLVFNPWLMSVLAK